jgi:hypothetical protein
MGVKLFSDKAAFWDPAADHTVGAGKGK